MAFHRESFSPVSPADSIFTGPIARVENSETSPPPRPTYAAHRSLSWTTRLGSADRRPQYNRNRSSEFSLNEIIHTPSAGSSRTASPGRGSRPASGASTAPISGVEDFSSFRARTSGSNTPPISRRHAETSNERDVGLLHQPSQIQRPSATAYEGNAGMTISTPDISRSKSLLHRGLKSLRAPLRAPKSLIGSKGRSGRERYAVLEEPEDEAVGVDISSLAGLGLELQDLPPPTSHVRQASAQSNTSDANSAGSEASDEMLPKIPVESVEGIGKGMVVGAQLRVNTAATGINPNVTAAPTRETVSELARAKTIRNIGQKVAQNRQVIVAVDEASPTVDLSSLEGTKGGSAGPKSFDTIVERAAADTTVQSYFYPEDPSPPNWKPFSMRTPYISLLIGMSLALAGIQEWLCQKSQSLSKQRSGILVFNDTTEVSTWNFVCWKYLPTLIFVAYGVLWQIMDFEIKRLEPYYQLSQRTGSTAAASLNLDHLSMLSVLVPFRAIKFRQWAVCVSAIGNLLATSVSASLQNPSVTFNTNPDCRHNICPPGQKKFIVGIQPVWSRFLSASLIVTALLGIFLLIQLRRKSGLLSDPKGIAGIAAMATKSHILNDFQGMDEATHKEIHKKLSHRRYVLYKSSIWQGEYIKQPRRDVGEERKVENPHPHMLRLKSASWFIAFLFACLISIPIINLTPARVIPNGAPWLPILVATFLKHLWTTFEFDLRLLEPFYILSSGNAPPHMTLTLDYRGTPYGWFPIKAILNGHYLVALVGVGSILVDILTVTVSSFSVNSENFIHHTRHPLKGSPDAPELSSGDQTFKSFWWSVALSIGILLFLILSAALVYWKRHHPFLPRQPSTIASVLAFIHESKMLFDFIDTERLGNGQMERRLELTDKRYGLGWFKGRDSRAHCGIDEEPLRSRYKHGVSYALAQAPWEQQNQEYEYA